MQAVTNLHPVLSAHPRTEIAGFWMVGRQTGNNPAERRSELGFIVTKNGVMRNFDLELADFAGTTNLLETERTRQATAIRYLPGARPPSMPDKP
jgi:hypothetical protein